MKRGLVILAGAFVSTLALVTPQLDAAPARASDVAGNPVIAAVGDLACDTSNPAYNDGAGTSSRCAEKRVSDAVTDDGTVDAVLGLGDFQYYCSDLYDWEHSYDPTWGLLDNLMDPVAGNHEYQTGTEPYGSPCPPSNSTAQNYFDHFGDAAHPGTYGHYSFDLGTWHIIALNANCGHAGAGCAATSAQTRWLNADLHAIDRVATPCVLAFWHQPLLTGVGTGVNKAYKPWWTALYNAHADVVLNGHVHNYQHFAPRDPTGDYDEMAGITEYVVGTGGEDLMSDKSTATPQPEAYKKTFGFLRMTLLPDGWKPSSSTPTEPSSTPPAELAISELDQSVVHLAIQGPT